MCAKLYLRSDNYLATHEKEMIELEVCEEGIDIMVAKMRHLVFMARGLDPRAANILKQEMLSVDGEAAIPYHAISDLDKPTDCLISGTQRQFQIAIAKLVCQPFGLKELAEELAFAIKSLDRPRKKLEIMGILNVTPDSFSDGGQYVDSKAAIARAIEMEKTGASMIDIGGESTRPGAESVSFQEQLERVISVIEGLDLKISISIDSRSPEVVEKALEAGAGMVNLVGGIRDENMAKLLAQKEVPVILMHMLGEPDNMQNDPKYRDVMDDIMDWARAQIELAEKAGISREHIIIDPGIGFGKTLEHNLLLLRNIDKFVATGYRVLVGPSRKSFIGKITGKEKPAERIFGTAAAVALCAAAGVSIVRVHDVAEMVDVVKVANKLNPDFPDEIVQRK